MIQPGLSYGRAATVEEAFEAFRSEQEAGRKAVYYAGGTEAATLGRKGLLEADTLIDLKGIPEAMTLESEGGFLRIGAAIPLNTVIDSGLFPLFSLVASGIADRTVRNRLSVGGNIAGRLPYREAVLPFLVTDASVVLSGPEGLRRQPLMDCFNKRIALKAGEFILRFEVPEAALHAPFYSLRRTGPAKVDYPIVHVAGLKAGGVLRVAISGLCAYPFRTPAVEEALAASGPEERRVRHALTLLPGPVREDLRAGREYRLHLSALVLREILENLEEAE